MIADAAGPCSVEEYAARQFRNLGFNAFVTWNATFQVLFAVYMCPVIQDPTDAHNRVIAFPDRKAFDAGVRGTLIWTRLPDDFGTRAYALRRADVIKKHLEALLRESRGLQDLILEFPQAKGSIFLQEGLIHRTSKGFAVRSKSELIIAEALTNAGISFAYEKPLTLGDQTRYPDFTIDDEISGRTIYWEHLGMLERPDYHRSWEKKLVARVNQFERI